MGVYLYNKGEKKAGSEPVNDHYDTLEKMTERDGGSVLSRIDALGDCSAGRSRGLGGGVSELKTKSSTFRLYYTELGDPQNGGHAVVLNASMGKDKGEQQKAIEQAKEYRTDLMKRIVTERGNAGGNISDEEVLKKLFRPANGNALAKRIYGQSQSEESAITRDFKSTGTKSNDREPVGTTHYLNGTGEDMGTGAGTELAGEGFGPVPPLSVQERAARTAQQNPSVPTPNNTNMPEPSARQPAAPPDVSGASPIPSANSATGMPPANTTPSSQEAPLSSTAREDAASPPSPAGENFMAYSGMMTGLVSAGNRFANTDNTGEKVMAGVEGTASVTGTVLQLSGEVKGAGVVGAVVSGLDTVYSAGQTYADARAKGETVTQATLAAGNKAVEGGSDVALNMLTVGMAGGAGSTLIDQVEQGHVLMAVPKALEKTTPVQLAENGYKSVRTIAQTEATYSSVDAAFKPDAQRHRNFISAENRILSDPHGQQALADALPKGPDGKVAKQYLDDNGKISADTLNTALADPKNGKAVQDRLKALIKEQQKADYQTMDNNDTNMPRFMQFTDAQAQRRLNYESAQHDARIMGSAGQEMEGALAEFQQKRDGAERTAKAQAQAQQIASAINTPTTGGHDVDTHSAPLTAMAAQSGRPAHQGVFK